MSRLSRVFLVILLTALIALLVIGVRSFWWVDSYLISLSSNRRCAVAAHHGRLYLIYMEKGEERGGSGEFSGDLGYKCQPADSPNLGMENFETRFVIFRWQSISAWFVEIRCLGIPIWLIGGVVAMPGLFIWLRHRSRGARGRGFAVQMASAGPSADKVDEGV